VMHSHQLNNRQWR